MPTMNPSKPTIRKATGVQTALTHTEKRDTKTNVKTKADKPKNKTVTLDPKKHLKGADIARKVDLILLIDTLKPVRKELAESVKDAMFDGKAKFADGEAGMARLDENSTPQVVNPLAFLKFCEKKGFNATYIAQFITVPKGKVEVENSPFSPKDIAGMSEDGDRKAPSFEFNPLDPKAPPTLMEAMKKITGEMKAHPKLFEQPAK